MTETTTRSYSVTGMTCDHCVASVQEEVEEITGVEDVQVDLTTGALEVRGSGFSDEDVAAAVDEAGYELAQAA